MKTLPRKLWKLATIALKDLKAIERDPRYKVEMEVWHDPSIEPQCSVCMAGSVLARTLKYPIGQSWDGSHRHKAKEQLRAIDRLRVGDVQGALQRVRPRISLRDLDKVMPLNRSLPDYHSGKARFKERFRRLISDLKRANL